MTPPITWPKTRPNTRQNTRSRADRCPGALRPWRAADGLLVRLRLVGGRLPAASLLALVDVAEQYGDGRVSVTARANLQLRALPGHDAHPDDAHALPEEVLRAIERTGLLPSRTHELVRNIVVSPVTGRAGGRTDLRPVAAALDEGLCAGPRLSRLPGRFLFVLDDGRGDVVARSCDLGLVALDEASVQLRVGEGWGPVVPRGVAVAALVGLAETFLDRRGTGPAAAWHVAELAEALAPAGRPDPGVPPPSFPLPTGPVPGGRHVPVSADGLDRRAVQALVETGAPELVVTPWRGVFVPGEEPS